MTLGTLDPSTLRHLGHALIARARAAEDAQRAGRRRLRPEAVEQLAEFIAQGDRPTIGWWRRNLIGADE